MMSSEDMIDVETCPMGGVVAVDEAPTPGAVLGADDGTRGDETEGVPSERGWLDIRGFLPLEVDSICDAISLAQSQARLLSAELTNTHEALRVERARRTALEQALSSRDTIDTSHLKSVYDRLCEEHEALQRASAGDRASSVARVAGLEKDLERLQADVSRLEKEKLEQAGVIQDMRISLRLAENKSRRLEFELQEQDDDSLDLRLFLQSALHTMNKHAREAASRSVASKSYSKKTETIEETGATKSAKVRRLVDRVKASDTGVDVTNLSVAEVQGFLSLLVRRIQDSSVSAC